MRTRSLGGARRPSGATKPSPWLLATIAGLCLVGCQPSPIAAKAAESRFVLTHPEYPTGLPLKVPRAMVEWAPGFPPADPSQAWHVQGVVIRMPITPDPACEGVAPFLGTVGLSTPDYVSRSHENASLSGHRFERTGRTVENLQEFEEKSDLYINRNADSQGLSYVDPRGEIYIRCSTRASDAFRSCDGEGEISLRKSGGASVVVEQKIHTYDVAALARRMRCAVSQTRALIDSET